MPQRMPGGRSRRRAMAVMSDAEDGATAIARFGHSSYPISGYG